MGGNAGGQFLQALLGEALAGLARVGDDGVDGKVLDAGGFKKSLFTEEWHK